MYVQISSSLKAVPRVAIQKTLPCLPMSRLGRRHVDLDGDVPVFGRGSLRPAGAEDQSGPGAADAGMVQPTNMGIYPLVNEHDYGKL